MKILISLFSIFVLTGCATSTKDKEYSDITKDDFKTKKQIAYNQNKDKFKGIEDANYKVLGEESLSRFSDPGDLEARGVLDEITISCYERDFDKAFSLIKEKSAEYKRNPVFWNKVGTCFMLKGERRKALLFYNKALEFKASYAPAFNNLGFMYKLENEDQKALVAFTRAKKANEYAKTPLFNLGNLYLEYGLFSQAISTFTGLYNIEKRDVDVLNGLAVAYLMQGNSDRSLSFYKEINPDFLEKPEFGINYSLALFRANKKKNAKDALSDIDKEKLGPWKAYYIQVASIVGVK